MHDRGSWREGGASLVEASVGKGGSTDDMMETRVQILFSVGDMGVLASGGLGHLDPAACLSPFPEPGQEKQKPLEPSRGLGSRALHSKARESGSTA